VTASSGVIIAVVGTAMALGITGAAVCASGLLVFVLPYKGIKHLSEKTTV
jgi:hypothetical protein